VTVFGVNVGEDGDHHAGDADGDAEEVVGAVTCFEELPGEEEHAGDGGAVEQRDAGDGRVPVRQQAQVAGFHVHDGEH
jgi:hypothetical protein